MVQTLLVIRKELGQVVLLVTTLVIILVSTNQTSQEHVYPHTAVLTKEPDHLHIPLPMLEFELPHIRESILELEVLHLQTISLITSQVILLVIRKEILRELEPVHLVQTTLVTLKVIILVIS